MRRNVTMLAAAAGVALLSGMAFRRNRGMNWSRMMRRVNWSKWAPVAIMFSKRLLRR